MHYFILAFLVQALLGCGTAAISKGFTLGSFTPQVISAPSPDVPSTNVLKLGRKIGSKSAHYLSNIRNNQQSNGVYQYDSAPLVGLSGGVEYTTDMFFGDQTFTVIVDTGSSDTWLVGTNFTCINEPVPVPLPEFACEFGTTYNVTEEFRQIPGENLNITYGRVLRIQVQALSDLLFALGDGSFVTGIFGFQDVTLAGVTVNQQIAIVDQAAWQGDGVSSGLIGLAYPSITSAYQGTDPTQDSGLKQLQYNPIFTTMVVDELVKPVFSLAIERGDFGGYLTLGGLPPVTFVHRFAHTPIQILTLKAYGLLTQYSFYTITTDGFRYPGSEQIKLRWSTSPNSMKQHASVTGFQVNQPSNITSFQVVVDSGTTLIYLPTDLADDINSKFSPPAGNDFGVYAVDCDAKIPQFAVVIGGQNFWINPRDMILNDDGTCFSGIADGGTGPYILGDVFFKNVIAVFDVGAAEMRFAPREFYPN